MSPRLFAADECVQFTARKPAMTSWGTERLNPTSVGPYTQGRHINPQEVARLTQGHPPVR